MCVSYDFAHPCVLRVRVIFGQLNTLPILHSPVTSPFSTCTVELNSIQINWDGELSGYAENPDNWIFLWKEATVAVGSRKKFCKWLF